MENNKNTRPMTKEEIVIRYREENEKLTSVRVNVDEVMHKAFFETESFMDKVARFAKAMSETVVDEEISKELDEAKKAFGLETRKFAEMKADFDENKKELEFERGREFIRRLENQLYAEEEKFMAVRKEYIDRQKKYNAMKESARLKEIEAVDVAYDLAKIATYSVLRHLLEKKWSDILYNTRGEVFGDIEAMNEITKLNNAFKRPHKTLVAKKDMTVYGVPSQSKFHGEKYEKYEDFPASWKESVQCNLNHTVMYGGDLVQVAIEALFKAIKDQGGITDEWFTTEYEVEGIREEYYGKASGFVNHTTVNGTTTKEKVNAINKGFVLKRYTRKTTAWIEMCSSVRHAISSKGLARFDANRPQYTEFTGQFDISGVKKDDKYTKEDIHFYGVLNDNLFTDQGDIEYVEEKINEFKLNEVQTLVLRGLMQSLSASEIAERIFDDDGNPYTKDKVDKIIADVRKKAVASGFGKEEWANGESPIFESKDVYVYKVNGTYVGHFTSVSKASSELNVDKGTISKVLNGNRKSTMGYVFTRVAR